MKDKSFQMDGKVLTDLGKIKQRYVDALILISTHWAIEFHVHTNAFNLVVGAMLAWNLNGKCNQLIAYASHLFNNVE
jgi:hypothetical protein